jgi:hypothetical protein
MNHVTNRLASTLAAVAGMSALLASGPGAADALYGTSSLNALCEEAQRIVTSTDLEVNNAVYTQWAGFVQSDAAPYSVIPGSTPLEYSPPEAPDRPLSSTQHMFFNTYPGLGGEYPGVVSCKMKNADYLNARDPQLGAVDQPCQAVNLYYFGKVLATLPRGVRLRTAMQVVLDDDVTADRGSEWTFRFPDSPYPVLYREYERGPLHIRGAALYVPPNPESIPFAPNLNFIQACNLFGGPESFLGSACEPRKWGVRYCHLPSPEYMRAALVGAVDVPTCGTPTADARVCP